ncbi:2-oxo-4-hydroxy-4-carboxy-5-ureidoimidazoline decarboxylase [Psychromonas sp.]|nr:2-oxo-4-hydroxy-4-carboxy-5-ureidoimidazoline decarboxylase [Psychromonas sp.]
MSLEKINNANTEEIYRIFESCCCAPKWIESMTNARPFAQPEDMLTASDKIFKQLTKADYLIAFEGHPQIGNLQTLQSKYANTSESASHEQSGMSEADKSVIEEMHDLNLKYLEKFGFIFIVCASGKSAQQMLDLIKSRINNEHYSELTIAGIEQAKITHIRLEKLL